jgi:hypothetical protein
MTIRNIYTKTFTERTYVHYKIDIYLYINNLL